MKTLTNFENRGLLRAVLPGSTLALLLGISACTPPRYGVDPGAIDRAGAYRLSSDEIRSIATAAIENQIRLAELAENGTSSATIREYAALVIQEQRALAEGWRTIPVDNPRVRHQFAIQLDQRSERAASEMGQVGNSIGPSYLDHERDQHHWFIALLDNSLIPSADDPYLLAQLRRARAIAEEEQAALARL